MPWWKCHKVPRELTQGYERCIQGKEKVVRWSFLCRMGTTTLVTFPRVRKMLSSHVCRNMLYHIFPHGQHYFGRGACRIVFLVYYGSRSHLNFLWTSQTSELFWEFHVRVNNIFSIQNVNVFAHTFSVDWNVQEVERGVSRGWQDVSVRKKAEEMLTNARKLWDKDPLV